MLVCRRASGVNSASSKRTSCLIREPSSSVVEFFREIANGEVRGKLASDIIGHHIGGFDALASPPEAKYLSMRRGMRRRLSTQVRTLL